MNINDLFKDDDKITLSFFDKFILSKDLKFNQIIYYPIKHNHIGYIDNIKLYALIHFKLLGYCLNHFTTTDIIIYSNHPYLKYIIPELLEYYE